MYWPDIHRGILSMIYVVWRYLYPGRPSSPPVLATQCIGCSLPHSAEVQVGLWGSLGSHNNYYVQMSSFCNGLQLMTFTLKMSQGWISKFYFVVRCPLEQTQRIAKRSTERSKTVNCSNQIRLTCYILSKDDDMFHWLWTQLLIIEVEMVGKFYSFIQGTMKFSYKPILKC